MTLFCDPTDHSTSAHYFSPSPRVCPNPCPLNQWVHPTTSSSVIPFSCPRSFPASGSFPMSRPFASGGQSIRASASASVLPMDIQDWFPLGLTGLFSLPSKGLSRVFSCWEPAREIPPVTRSGFKVLARKGVQTSGTTPHAKASGPPGVSQDRPTIHSQASILSSSDAWRSSIFPKN